MSISLIASIRLSWHDRALMAFFGCRAAPRPSALRRPVQPLRSPPPWNFSFQTSRELAILTECIADEPNAMDHKNRLVIRVLRAHLLMFVIIAALLFGPAGSINYWQGWVFLFLFVSLSLTVSLYLVYKDPELLERRLNIGPLAEQQNGQRLAMFCILVGSLGLVFLGCIDHLKNWSSMPTPLVLFGDFLVAAGWLIFFEVFAENSFASATVELAEDQKVVSTGLYGHVRHPMYAGAFIMLSGVPLALGTWWALIISALMMAALVWRLLAEEQFLSTHLPGYCDYRDQVPYRLFPRIW